MKNELISNATEFCTITSSELIANPALGHGTDGSVWRTSRGTAVKSFFYEKNYRDELECYLRLMKYEISEICGLAVPTYEDSSDSLLTLEMSIVQKPYLLDFGKVYIDEPPPYFGDRQLMENWYAEVRDLFESDAETVHSVLFFLQKFGIYYVDPKPANIRFR